MSIPQDSSSNNPWGAYMPLAAVAFTVATGVITYMCKRRKTPMIQKVEAAASEPFNKEQGSRGPQIFTASALDPETAALLPPEALETPRVLQRPLNEKAFIDHHYSGGTSRSDFYAARFSNVSRFYDLKTFVPVRGDGNCFVNAAAAGLLNKLNQEPHYTAHLISILEAYESSPNIYVQPDPQAQESHHKSFFKAGDFRQVLEKLRSQNPNVLFHDDVFNAAFTRILRYILSHSAPKDAASLRCGTEIDATAVWDFSRVFDLNVKVALIEGESPADEMGPNAFVITQGEYDQSIIDTKDTRPPEVKDSDFVIMRKSGHFICAY